jgi:hypothetical protein
MDEFGEVQCCGGEGAMLTAFPIFGDPPENLRRGLCDRPRLHEVDARMMPQDVLRPLFDEAADAFLAPNREMGRRAEALFLNPAVATGEALIIARRSFLTLNRRARRNFNVHAHADRCAPPGRDPGRGRQREPDRSI